MRLILPQKRTIKPQQGFLINKKSRQFDGLVGWWPFLDKTSTIAKDYSGNGNNGTLVNGPTPVAGKLGNGLKFNGTNQYASVTHNTNLQPYPFSVSFWIKGGTQATYAGILTKYYGGSYNGWNVFKDENGTVTFYYFSDNLNKIEYQSAPIAFSNVFNNLWNHILITVDDSGAKGYKNGLQVTSAPWVGTPNAPSSTAPLTLVNYVDYYFNGFLDDVRIYNRALSPVEVLDLYQNPFGIYNKQTGFNVEAVATTILLTLQAISQGQTLSSIDLNQQNSLSINNLSQGQTLENIALTQQNTILLDNITQIQTLNSLDLIQQNILDLATITQIQTIAEILLTQQYNLTLSNLTQSQAINNLDLSSAVILSIDNLNQPQNLTTLGLIQQNILTLAQLDQLQSLSFLDLAAQSTLNIDNLFQNQTIANLNLTQGQTLTINPISQAQLLSDLALIQQNILQVEDIFQTQSLSHEELIQNSILIIDNLLHQQFLNNLSLFNGEVKLYRDILYIMRDSSLIMILNSTTAAHR